MENKKESDNDEEYVAEKVLDRRIGKDGEVEYYVKWEGYDDALLILFYFKLFYFKEIHGSLNLELDI